MLRYIIISLILLWVVIMWAVIIYAIHRGWAPYIRSKRMKIERVPAVVGAKQGAQEIDPMTWQPQFLSKVLVFDCEDGRQRDYEVHDDVFEWVEEGDDGVLFYQGDLFVRFEARRPRHDHDKIHSSLTRR